MNRKKRRAVLRSLQKKGLVQVDEHGIWTQTAKVREAIAEADAEFDALYGPGEAKGSTPSNQTIRRTNCCSTCKRKGSCMWTSTAFGRKPPQLARRWRKGARPVRPSLSSLFATTTSLSNELARQAGARARTNHYDGKVHVRDARGVTSDRCISRPIAIRGGRVQDRGLSAHLRASTGARVGQRAHRRDRRDRWERRKSPTPACTPRRPSSSPTRSAASSKIAGSMTTGASGPCLSRSSRSNIPIVSKERKPSPPLQ